MTKKKPIPKALREQVWLKYFGGNTFKAKCPVIWCNNEITPFNYECGHNQPESKGGKTNIENLIPICSKCNKSMSDNYSIDEWQDSEKVIKGNKSLGKREIKKKVTRWFCCC